MCTASVLEMRVLILGASGMLGHKLVDVIGRKLETLAAVRRPGSFPATIAAADVVTVEAGDLDALARVLDRLKPDAVLNAVGVVKQSMSQSERSQTIAMNALFPNQLAESCSVRGIRLIHFSTDCVFSGARDSRRGVAGYREIDPADAHDLYGLSKLLGEPETGQHLVLRTSMIGRELRARVGLVEWFLNQPEPKVRGFTRALFTGLTTIALARLTLRLLTDHSSLSGLWHVAAQPISKHELLGLVKEVYGLSTKIMPDESVFCDRRLDGSRFSHATQWLAPDWPTMIAEMRQDPFAYDHQETDRRRVALPGGR
jgi:dTDP-4-dehydrorhamnose reductase